MSATIQVVTPSLAQVEEKFLRLLEVDRTSDEFEKLYAEVDAALDALLEAESGEHEASEVA